MSNPHQNEDGTVIKFEGEYELANHLLNEDGDPIELGFIDGQGETHDLSEYLYVSNSHSFDSVHGLTAWSYYAVIVSADCETVKLFYCYQSDTPLEDNPTRNPYSIVKDAFGL